MTKFASLFPFDNFSEILEHHNAAFGKNPTSPATDEWRKQNNLLEEKHFNEAISRFLDEKASQTALPEYCGSKNRRTGFTHAWNAIRNGEQLDDYEKRRVHHTLGDFFNRILFDAMNLASKERQTPYESWNELCKKFDEGNFSRFDLPSPELDLESGERFVTEIAAWQPRLYRVERLENFRSRLVPAEDAPQPKNIIHATVNFPSGNLIIGDWFRLPGFTEWADDKSPDFEINSRQGLEDRTLFYANKNFISVFVGNSSPSIFTQNGILCIGHHFDEDENGNPLPNPPKHVSRIGYVCTDLWNASVIDRDILIQAITKNGDINEAERLIDELINDGFAHTATVTPGIHHLYFGGNHHEFADNFATKDNEIGWLDEPFLVISQYPLELDDKNANQPKNKMKP